MVAGRSSSQQQLLRLHQELLLLELLQLLQLLRGQLCCRVVLWQLQSVGGLLLLLLLLCIAIVLRRLAKLLLQRFLLLLQPQLLALLSLLKLLLLCHSPLGSYSLQSLLSHRQHV